MGDKKNISSLLWKLVVVACFVIIIVLFARWIAYFKTGAEEQEIFNKTLIERAVHQPQITWTSNDQPHGAELDVYAKEEIEQAYAEAWHVLNNSIKNNKNIGLEDRYSLELVEEIESDLPKNSTLLNKQIDLSHNLELHLLSYNRQLISFTDKEARIKKRISTEDGLIIHESDELTNFQIVMELSDGKWKITSWVKTRQATTPPQVEPVNEAITSAITGVNYYPKNYPWFEFWENYSNEIVASDIDKAKKLGLNTFRVFIPYEQFGASVIQDSMIAKVENFLDLMEEREMQVALTLFDFPSSYSIDNYTAKTNHLRRLVTEFGNHPVIKLWDIKNELDLDFQHYGKKTCLDWLGLMIDQARTIKPDIKLTVGWSSPEHATLYKNSLDVISFHYYKESSELKSWLKKLKSTCNNKPLLLGEFGLSTYDPWYFPFGHSEDEQASHAKEILKILQKNQVSNYLYWTLNDFEDIDSKVVGWKPWVKNVQMEFGIYDLNEKEKAVAKIFKEHNSR